MIKKNKNTVDKPISLVSKKTIIIRLDRDIIKAFKTTGKDWKEKINEALKDWLSKNKLS